jgi:hypothetical protein
MEQSNGFTQLQRFEVHFCRESNRTSSHFVTDVKHVRSVNMPWTLQINSSFFLWLWGGLVMAVVRVVRIWSAPDWNDVAQVVSVGFVPQKVS